MVQVSCLNFKLFCRNSQSNSAAKLPKVAQYLCDALMYRRKTWYMDSWHLPELALACMLCCYSARPPPHRCLQLYLGVKQRSCETPIVFLLFSYCFLLLGVKQRSCETPIVFVLFPIIRGQAAKLRDTYCFRTFSYYYYPAIGVYGSPWLKVVKFGTLIQDSPISPHSKFEVASPWALAPPIGQSWTCIHVNNFWPIHPIFTNKVSLESLGQAEFNLWRHFASG